MLSARGAAFFCLRLHQSSLRWACLTFGTPSRSSQPQPKAAWMSYQRGQRRIDPARFKLLNGSQFQVNPLGELGLGEARLKTQTPHISAKRLEHCSLLLG